jgi:hypothetical protein
MEMIALQLRMGGVRRYLHRNGHTLPQEGHSPDLLGIHNKNIPKMPVPRNTFLRLSLLAFVSLVFFHPLAKAAGNASSTELPPARGEVILTVAGKIARTNGNGVAALDREMLTAVGLKTMKTSTNWTDGVNSFEGVLARDLLALVGATGSTVVATALNDYTTKIPIADFRDYDVLLALKMDGRELLARDKGPVWIVYPRDEVPALRDAKFDHRWVWQLRLLTVE